MIVRSKHGKTIIYVSKEHGESLKSFVMDKVAEARESGDKQVDAVLPPKPQ
jgi:hypothetical protein